MTSYHIEGPDGFREVTATEWKAAEGKGWETYSMHGVEGIALVAVDPSGSFSFEGVRN